MKKTTLINVQSTPTYGTKIRDDYLQGKLGKTMKTLSLTNELTFLSYGYKMKNENKKMLK